MEKQIQAQDQKEQTILETEEEEEEESDFIISHLKTRKKGVFRVF